MAANDQLAFIVPWQAGAKLRHARRSRPTSESGVKAEGNLSEGMRWLQADEPARKEGLFERMSQGWAIGSRGFRQAVVADDRAQRAVAQLTHAAAGGRAKRHGRRCLRELKIGAGEAMAGPKAAALGELHVTERGRPVAKLAPATTALATPNDAGILSAAGRFKLKGLNPIGS